MKNKYQKILILITCFTGFLTACSYCNCKQEIATNTKNLQNTTQAQKDIKYMNMLEEIYALPKPTGFDIKDVSYIVKKYITPAMKKQEIIDILVKKYGFRMNEVNGKTYFGLEKGIPMFTPGATVISIRLFFGENNQQASSIEATYKINQ